MPATQQVTDVIEGLVLAFVQDLLKGSEAASVARTFVADRGGSRDIEGEGEL